MGIRGLKKYLDYKSMNKVINWFDYEDKTIAIDIQAFLYKARSEDKNPFEVIGSFLFELLNQNTQVFIVFDGKAPKEKSTIMTARKEERRETISTIELISKEIESGVVPDKEIAMATIKQLKSKTPILKYDDAKNMKKFCYTMGFTYYQANGEADNFLAHLSNNNLVDAIISPDMDLLARGVKNLIVPESNIPQMNNQWKVYNLDSILAMMKFSYDQFVMFCVMLGCDYTYGIQNVPIKFAYDAIRVHKDLTKAYDAVGGNMENIITIEKAYDLLGYSDRKIEDLLGMSSAERFVTKTFLVPEVEHIDELEISDDLKTKYKIKLNEMFEVY